MTTNYRGIVQCFEDDFELLYDFVSRYKIRVQNFKNYLKSGKNTKSLVIFREGPVHAVSYMFDSIDDNKEVIVSYCDYGTDWNYVEFLKDTRERNADGAIACYKGFHPHILGTDNYAFLQETEIGSRWMKAIQEKKPFTENRMNEYASNGTYYFKTGAIMKKYFKELMEQNMKINNEYYVSMVYNLLVRDHLNISIFEIEHMLQWGTPNDLEIYKGWSSYFMDTTIQEDIPDKYDTTLILPMAGAGNRFAVKGYNKPKPLLDVCNKPMIIQAVDCLPDTTNKIFICLEDHIKIYNIDSILQDTYSGCSVISLDQITQGQACTTEIGVQKRQKNLDKPILHL